MRTRVQYIRFQIFSRPRIVGGLLIEQNVYYSNGLSWVIYTCRSPPKLSNFVTVFEVTNLSLALQHIENLHSPLTRRGSALLWNLSRVEHPATTVNIMKCLTWSVLQQLQWWIRGLSSSAKECVSISLLFSKTETTDFEFRLQKSRRASHPSIL